MYCTARVHGQRPLWRICALKGSSAHQASHCIQQSHRKLLQNHFSRLSLLESSFKMSKIIVFSQEAFEGRSAEFSNDVNSLGEQGYNYPVFSIKVIGNPWVAYYGKSFSGRQKVFEEGEYAVLEDTGVFSSLKIVTHNLSNPEIQLFEHTNYCGRSVNLRNETNLHTIDFGDIASSHNVKSGVWVLYQHTNRQGSQLVTFPGDQVPSYVPLSFNDVASHVRPLMPRH